MSCLICLRDYEEEPFKVRACSHIICDHCFGETDQCPYAFCVGGEYQDAEAERERCLALIETVKVHQVPGPTVYVTPSANLLNKLPNPVAIYRDRVYCVATGNLIDYGVLDEIPNVEHDTIGWTVARLVGVSFADYTVDVRVIEDNVWNVYRFSVITKERRFVRTEIPDFQSDYYPELQLAAPWYVYNMDKQLAQPVMRLVDPPPDPNVPDESHFQTCAEQLREALRSRVKQLEYAIDAQERLEYAKKQTESLDAEHPFRKQLESWKAMPIELSFYPQELTEFEASRTNVEGLNLGNCWAYVTRDGKIRGYIPCEPKENAAPVRIEGLNVMHNERKIATLPPGGPYGVVWSPITHAVLITRVRGCVFKFYCYEGICV
jgi:hypothetical protein